MDQLPEIVQILILAVVQGIGEFLPISSSGHLVVAAAAFGRQQSGAELSIVLHFGTLLAILVFYRERILALLRHDRRVIPLLIVGTIPAAGIGLWVKRYHENLLENALLAGFMFPVTAFLLMSLPRLGGGKKGYQEIGWWSALFIGMAQAIALLPGISRSGITIVAGCLLGLKRQAAATFSFLLAIPAIGGASVLEAKDILENGATTPIPLLVLGAATAFGVGWFSLKLLVRWVEAGKLHYFAFWLLPFGFVVIVWQIMELASRAASGG